jgi:hypothetical protein
MSKVLFFNVAAGKLPRKKWGRPWDNLAQQSGDLVLQENGSKILLGFDWPEFLLAGKSEVLLLENGGKIKLNVALGHSTFGIYRVQKIKGKRISLQQKFYVPYVSPESGVHVYRAKFAAGVLAWQGLTTAQKMVYNKRVKRLPLSGYNLFLREFLLAS